MLAEIQLRLQSRYQGLAEARQQSGYPVYALEHGLSVTEIANLKTEASAESKYQAPHLSHWLVWVALGAEAGYGYSGDEFWPALEVRHGEWRNNDHRKVLRDFYRRFVQAFRGPEPVGRWAEHFSLIAWPINHAILPKYLQAHFARHLFELRHELSHVVHRDGHAIGDFLFKRYYGSSSRFRDFLQQTDLTSQIVLALRDVDLQVAAPRIDTAVLKRIVTDLEGRHDARSYLRDTRKLIHSTAIKLGPQLQPRGDAQASSASVHQSSLQRFRLVARRGADRRRRPGRSTTGGSALRRPFQRHR